MAFEISSLSVLMWILHKTFYSFWNVCAESKLALVSRCANEGILSGSIRGPLYRHPFPFILSSFKVSNLK